MAPRRPIPVVSVGEFEPVHLPAALDTAQTRERLQAVALRAGFAAFEIRGRRLVAQGVVGVVDAGNVVVEILPKVRAGSAPGEDAAFLGDLLRFAGDGRAPALSPAAIASVEGGLLEVLLAWAARLLADNLREGLPRRYVEREEASTSVRGRIDLRRLAGQHPGRALDLTVRHAPLGSDNPVSRLMGWLSRAIAARTRSVRTRSLCVRLSEEFGEVAAEAPDVAVVDDIVLRPFEERWTPLVAFARSLMGDGRLDPARGGEVPAVAVLFTLHDLFEGALRRVLAAGLPEFGLSILGGRVGHLLLGDGRPSLVRMRPDFRIGVAGAPATSIVGDAKWKRILDQPGEVRLGEDDAYQLAAYASALRADRAFIACPIPSAASPLRREAFKLAGIERPLELVGVHLPTLVRRDGSGDQLRRDLCRLAAGQGTAASADGVRPIPAAA